MLLWQVVAFIALALGCPVVGELACAQHSTANSRTEIGTNTKPPPPSVQDSLNRIATTIEAAQNGPQIQQDQQRAKDNLAAQQHMANWAFGAMLAAALEVLISAVGIFLIWRTLIHTRNAAQATQRMAFDNTVAIAAAVEANNAMREANRIAREDIRPYLLFVGARLEEGKESRSNFFRVVVVLKNDGARPAVIKSCGRSSEQATGNPVPLVAPDEIGFLKADDIVGRQSEGAVAFRVYKSHIFPWTAPGPSGRTETPKVVRFRAMMRVSYRGITDPDEVTHETEIHVNVQLSATSDIRSTVEAYNRREIYR